MNLRRTQEDDLRRLASDPEQFLQTIYLGDRTCKAVLIDSWEKRAAVQVNVISRLRLGAKAWDFYTEGDIVDGWLVFSEVSSISLEPPGPLPNDLINEISVRLAPFPHEQPVFLFELSVGSVDHKGETTEVRIRIEAQRIHLEDPAQPGERCQESEVRSWWRSQK